MCHSSSSEQRAGRFPGSDNPSVYSHAALRKVQESAPPNAAQTQASKSVRPAGVRHMPAQTWSLRFPPSPVPLCSSLVIPDPFCLFFSLPDHVNLSLFLFSLSIPLVCLFRHSNPLSPGFLACSSAWPSATSRLYIQLAAGSDWNVCRTVCERLETDKCSICFRSHLNPAERKLDDHLYTCSTIFNCMAFAVGLDLIFLFLLHANARITKLTYHNMI